MKPTFFWGSYLKSKISEYLKDESGQTSTEYILLVAVVAMIIIRFKDTLNEKLKSIMNTSLGGIEQKIQNDLNN